MGTQIRSSTASLALVATAMLTWPVAASAHVKWFVPQNGGDAAAPSPFSLAEPAVQLWLGVLLAAVLLALLLDRYLPEPHGRLARFNGSHGLELTNLFQLLVGLALLLTAVNGAILAPHLKGVPPVGIALRFGEGTIGVLLIANTAVRWAAGSMVVLFLASTIQFGLVSSLEYFNFLGIAVFLMLSSSPAGPWADRCRPYAMPLLRVHLGIALGVVAWTEKLIDPALAMRFLEQNQLNFMKALGAEGFSDRLFVLCAGCSELLFAIIFALGLVTRINTLVLAAFLISSNTYFFLVGKTPEAFLELTGHLPLFAIAVMLILHGSGGKLRITSLVFRRASARPRVDVLPQGCLPAGSRS